MSSRRASFDASYTVSLGPSPTYTKAFNDSYRTVVANNDPADYIGIYNWDFTYIDDQYSTIVTQIGNSTITNVQLAFKYHNALNAKKLSFLKYDGGDPKFMTGLDVFGNISATELATLNITSTNKTDVLVDLDDEDGLYYGLQLAIAAGQGFTVAIQRDTDLSASDGSVELSGPTLVGGTSEWRDAQAAEPTDPPLLVITYDVVGSSHPGLQMRYTTSDPTVDQSTPSNSIGQYVAPNEVYSSGDIASSISSTQVTVPIDSDSSLPSDTGLASVGPEIFKFTATDTTNHQLTGVTRAISPAVASPAGFDSFRIPEKVYYLTDLNDLFDTRPPSGLVQYRCVAIINSDTTNDFNIGNAFIGILQDPDADVQLRIGVELPRFDSVTGTAEDDTNETSTTLLVDTSFSEDDGYYDGALIKFLDPVDYAIVDSYTSDGEFVLDRAVTSPDLDAGREFVIMPAPAQSISNDAATPSSNSGRFSGFEEMAEGISVDLLDHGLTMNEHDLFYVWIRRTLSENAETSNDTGAVLIFRFKDTS